MPRPKMKVTLQEPKEPKPQTIVESDESGASTAAFPIREEARRIEAAVIARELRSRGRPRSGFLRRPKRRNRPDN
jgi:hypothetical protein